MDQVNMFVCILFTPMRDNNLIDVECMSKLYRYPFLLGVGNMITRFGICVRITRIRYDIT